MHAAVMTFRVTPGKTEEAVLIYLGSVVPKMREQRGFRGGLVLSSAEMDEGYTVALWETEEDVEAYESSGLYQQQVAKFGNLLAEPPTRELYEVSMQM